MIVTILGSGTAVPSLERNSAAILIQDGTTHSLFDLGYGTLHRLLELGLTYHDINRIFFTHIHPDHMSDLIMFLFGSRYGFDPRTKNLEIVAAPGFRAFFDQLMGVFRTWLIPDTYNIKIIEQDEETREYDGLTVTTKKVKHMDLSRGYRVTDEKGNTVAFSGDTDYSENMIELGKNADLLVLECSTPDELKIEGHLTPTLAGKMGREAGCKKLCLNHFYPVCDLGEVWKACSREYPGELILAKDRLRFEF